MTGLALWLTYWWWKSTIRFMKIIVSQLRNFPNIFPKFNGLCCMKLLWRSLVNTNFKLGGFPEGWCYPVFKCPELHHRWVPKIFTEDRKKSQDWLHLWPSLITKNFLTVIEWHPDWGWDLGEGSELLSKKLSMNKVTQVLLRNQGSVC